MGVTLEAGFHWSDYLVFGLMLLVSLGIGMYQAICGSKKTTHEYHLGSRAMGLVPVTMSLVVSYISTITLIGYPAEMFAFGVQYYWFTLGIFLGILLSTFVCVPLFYPLKLTSVNEYLWLRYESRVIQYIGTFTSVIGTIFYIGSVFYGPAVSIEAVIGFPAWISILIIGAVSVIYTAIGGFKAVVYTDVFQCFIMFAGMIAVLVQAIISVGGFENMWNLNKKWGRLNFFVFDPDPTLRINFWGAVFGNAFTVLGVYGYNQSGMQRYSSMPTINKARWCLMGMVPGNVLMQTLAFLCGLAMFAYYADIGCDPKELGLLTSYNQMMPYFVSTIFSIPVIPGLFLAAIYAASLSSASTCLNGISAVLWKDLFERQHDFSDRVATFINQMISVFAGLLGVGIAVGLSMMRGGTLVQISSTFGAATGGPVFALFFMGAFIPWITWQGAAIGSLCGSAFGVWISLGSYFYGASWEPMPSPMENCSSYYNTSVDHLGDSYSTAFPSAYSYNLTTATHGYNLTTSALDGQDEKSGLEELYSLSFLWMRESIAGVTIVLAIIFSALSGFRKANTVEEQFVHPIVRRCVTLKADTYVPEEELKDFTRKHKGSYISVDYVRPSTLHGSTEEIDSM